MSSTSKVLFPSAFLANGAVALLYTSPVGGKGTYLDVATALNDNAAAQTVTINIVPAGGGVAAGNQQVKAKSVAAGVTDLLPEIRGKFLAAGDSVWGAGGAATSISLFLSGRELT